MVYTNTGINSIYKYCIRSYDWGYDNTVTRAKIKKIIEVKDFCLFLKLILYDIYISEITHLAANDMNQKCMLTVPL
jgi:hypothetical protein